uniref:Beta-galactosidase n=1 Tax=Rhizophora mucronata TaxID=61149 RepID=A0A2P2PQZ3_RHIMU
MGSGASACWHITQGTPVSRDTAISAAQLIYVFAAGPYAESIFPYSFSICDTMMGPPWDA